MPTQSHVEHAHVHEHGHFSLFSNLIEGLLHGPLEGLGLSHAWAEAIMHVVSDFLDITLLLLIVVAIVSYLQTFIPYDKMRERIKRVKGPVACILALLLGMASPFCSCTIIPIMIGFLAAGVPLTYCLIFLSAASSLNLTALTSIFAGFPLPFALGYLGCALATCLLVAHFVPAVGGDRFIRMDKLRVSHDDHHHDEKQMGRLKTAICGAGNVYKNVWFFVLIGVAISALVSVFASEELMQRLLVGNPVALPLATLIGGALHSDVFSIMPIVQMLYSHSAAVALSFLLSTMLFSVAEWALLSRVFRPRLIAIYCAGLLALSLICGLVAGIFI